MTTTKKMIASAFLIAALAGTAIYHQLMDKQSVARPKISSEQTIPRDRNVTGGGESLIEQIARAKAAKPPVDLRKELERLKLKWLVVGGGNDKIREQDALASESAEVLMCSREMLDLLKFLSSHEMRYAVVKTDYAVEALFGTAKAAEARQLLVELPETAKVREERSYKSVGEPYRDRWSLAAGKTCPEDQFDSFIVALNCRLCAQEALYGRNLTLMRTDPEAAFTSSLEAFASGVPSISGRYGITMLFESELPPDVDFAKFEEQLPADGTLGKSDRPFVEIEAYTEIRQKLFWYWAKIDPAGAANHVLANPDRLAPRLMEEVVGGYSYRDLDGLIGWVSGFPEGPYFDLAARSAAVYARGRPGIDELIQRIQDPKLRQQARERAKVPLANPNTR